MKPRTAALALLLMTVVIVWQVPHTTVFRYTLLVVVGVIAWPTAVVRLANPASPLERTARAPFAMLALFLGWSLVVALFLSPRAGYSLTALRVEWLAPTLVLLMGYGLGLRFGERDWLARVLFLALALHAFMQLVSALYLMARGVEIHFENFGGIGDHKANVTYTNSLALAMLVGDTAARVRGGRGFLGIDMRWAVGAFALLLASTILATTRNGLIVFALMTVAGFAMVARGLRARAARGWPVLLACGLIAFVAAVVGLKADPRWSTFVATAPVAWDTQKNRQWLLGERNETDLPLTAARKPVEPSAYYRIAFLKEGAKLVLEHPWGTRVGRDAFQLAMRDKYGSAAMSHAHNGFIDMGVSVGLPGLALWLAFLASFVYLAWRAEAAAGRGLRAAMVLVIAGFAARTCLDATVRDHVLQEFMLVAGGLAGALALGERRGD